MAQRFRFILNAWCVVEKPGQRRKIETCPDILALVKNAVAEPSNEAAVSDSYFRGAYACLRCYRRLERIVKLKKRLYKMPETDLRGQLRQAGGTHGYGTSIVVERTVPVHVLQSEG